jgi:hypothetical protein
MNAFSNTLKVPRFRCEIQVAEQLFPFSAAAYANEEKYAYGKVERAARLCGLTPVRRLAAERIKEKEQTV